MTGTTHTYAQDPCLTCPACVGPVRNLMILGRWESGMRGRPEHRYFAQCPRCGRRGPWESCVALARIAWVEALACAAAQARPCPACGSRDLALVDRPVSDSSSWERVWVQCAGCGALHDLPDADYDERAACWAQWAVCGTAPAPEPDAAPAGPAPKETP